MNRSLLQLTIAMLLMAFASAQLFGQVPGPDAGAPSVLMPGGMNPQMSPAYGDPAQGGWGNAPIGAYQPYEPGYDGDAACEPDDSWALGPHRPHLCGTWGGVDTLVWWNRGRHVPALVTTSNAADRGVLGNPSTTVLYGDDQIGGGARLGGRLTLGAWLDPATNVGLGFRAYGVDGDRPGYTNASDGSTVLARPFFNASLNAEDAILIGLPGVSSGNIAINNTNSFLATEIFGRFFMAGDDLSRIDLIAGYQFARLDDSLQISSRTTILDPLSPIVGGRFDVFDYFRGYNEFHGGLIGLMGERRNGRAKISWLTKLAVGNMREQVSIAGDSTLHLAGGGTAPINGGLFAQKSNIGNFQRNELAFIPELNLNLHYLVTPRFDVSLGYSFIYFSRAAFAGDQIDRQVNLTQQSGVLVGRPRPHETFHDTDFWFQGLNLGCNWNF